MNWDDVRFFLALCREGSLSRAADALSVNHTTVARRIAALEEALGARLFDRTREGYAMTQAAENMYEPALDMEAHALTINRTVFGQDAELKGSLRLTVPYDFANRILAPALPAFRLKYPAIDLELLTTTDFVDMAAREADIAVRLTARPPEFLVGRKIMPLRHGVYASPDYLAERPETPRVILFRSQRTTPEWMQQHFPDAHVVLYTDNVTTMRSAVASGLGLARMPCFVADPDPALRRLDLALTPSDWAVWILSHVDL
ncbi:MAG: LysR family transcriptional regulator, partial [Pseudomonadota bacterium]